MKKIYLQNLFYQEQWKTVFSYEFFYKMNPK